MNSATISQSLPRRGWSPEPLGRIQLESRHRSEASGPAYRQKRLRNFPEWYDRRMTTPSVPSPNIATESVAPTASLGKGRTKQSRQLAGGWTCPDGRIRLELTRNYGLSWWAYIADVADPVGMVSARGTNLYTVFHNGSRTMMVNPVPVAGLSRIAFVGRKSALAALVGYAEAVQARRDARIAILRGRWMRLQCKLVLLGEDTEVGRRIARLQSKIQSRLWSFADEVYRELNAIAHP